LVCKHEYAAFVPTPIRRNTGSSDALRSVLSALLRSIAMNTPASDVPRPLALVTGASTGIGYELARKLAERGYDLVMVAENTEKLNEAADSLSDIDDVTQVEVVQADLSQREGVRKVYDCVHALQRPVDLLAANAGVGVYGGFSDETDLEEEIALINLNVTSQVHLIKLISRDMLERGGGDILITSSVAGVLPGPRMAVYAASKAFLRSFGQAIRNELKDKGVHVTVLMPGPTDTEFFERAKMEGTVVDESAKQDPAEVAEAALAALSENEGHVVPGMKNKLQMGAAKMMSDETKAKVHGKQTQRKH
jgi:short-subunit dehydrogenase